MIQARSCNNRRLIKKDIDHFINTHTQCSLCSIYTHAKNTYSRPHCSKLQYFRIARHFMVPDPQKYTLLVNHACKISWLQKLMVQMVTALHIGIEQDNRKGRHMPRAGPMFAFSIVLFFALSHSKMQYDQSTKISILKQRYC